MVLKIDSEDFEDSLFYIEDPFQVKYGFEEINNNLSLEEIIDRVVTVVVVIVVSSVKRDKNSTTAQMGIEKINMKDIESIPVLLGEKDLLKAIRLLPGISSSSEGSSGFYVRGGRWTKT